MNRWSGAFLAGVLAGLSAFGCDSGTGGDDGARDATDHGADDAAVETADDAADEVADEVASEATDEGPGDTAGDAGCGADPHVAEEILGAGSDPAGGSFTLDEALDGLPAGDGPLRAVINTEYGELTCTLEPELVPNGVANFVGLARGRRPWLDPVAHVWVKRRFYDGLLFHRIIDNFVIQGGDPLGTGYGGPGYRFADEITTLRHQPGTLAYANAGPDTNGSQFYITEVTTSTLDGGYTIFGRCTPLSLIQTLAALPTNSSDRPITDVHMLSVEITRCP